MRSHGRDRTWSPMPRELDLGGLRGAAERPAGRLMHVLGRGGGLGYGGGKGDRRGGLFEMHLAIGRTGPEAWGMRGPQGDR